MTDFTYSSEDLSATRVALKDYELFERRSFVAGMFAGLLYISGSLYKSGTKIAVRSVNPTLALSGLFVASMGYEIY